MQPYVIGIDIGTGSTKAVAVLPNGKVVARAQEHYTTISIKPHFSEQEPEVIWKAFVSCIQKIIALMGAPPALISLSSYMHSVMLVDAAGYHLTNIITWADTRSEAIAATLRSSADAALLYKHTGTPLHAMSPLTKIIWLQQNRNEVFKKSAKIISVKEYIWFRLFNVFEVDHSIASATGLLDIVTRQWFPSSLSLGGIDATKLSILVPTNFTRANISNEMAQALHLPANTLFCIGASDGCLANLGTGAITEGIGALTIGTSGALRITNQQPLYQYPAMTFNYLLDDHTFVCGGPVNNGGNVLQWLLRYFKNIETPSNKDYDDLFTVIENIPAGSEGLIFLPYLYGERAPLWDEQSCGVYFGIRASHTQDHFLRAAIEGVCFALNQVLELLDEKSGITQLNVSGGFIHSKIWMQILADITGKKLCLVQQDDASAVGAAYLGMKAIGMIKEYTAVAGEEKQFIQPDMEKHGVLKKFYAVYKSLYPALKDAMHQLYITNN